MFVQSLGDVVVFVLHSLVWECVHVGIIRQKTESSLPNHLALNSILHSIGSSAAKRAF